jgi:hypothetical protein
MPTLSLIAGALLALLSGQAASPAPAPACALLRPQEVAAVIGPARPLTVSNAATGSVCMFQGGNDRVMTVLTNTMSSADAAKTLWEAKKRIMAAKDLDGWPTPAYVGVVDTATDRAAIVGVLSTMTFVEVKAIDKSQAAGDLSAKLQTAMKALSVRLAAQK